MVYLWYMMELLPIIIISSFTLWTIFDEDKVADLLQAIFFLSLVGWLGSIVFSQGLSGGFPIIAISFIALASFGFLIQKVFKNTAVRLILGAIAITPFLCGGTQFVSSNFQDLRSEIEIDHDQELIVKCKEGKVTEVKQKLKAMDVITSISQWTIADPDATNLDDYLLVNVNDSKYNYKIVQKLEAIDGVIWIEENETWSTSSTASVPSTLKSKQRAYTVNDPKVKDQWNYLQLGMDEYHQTIKNSGMRPLRPAKLYIIDSGVNFQHEDLKGTLIGHNTQNKTDNERDSNGHGTHCAGVAAAISNNGIGIASFNPGPAYVQVGSVAVMNRFGFSTQARVIEGIIEAIDAGADVINMSFGGLSNQLKEEAYDDVFRYAKSKNIIIVAAAGNNATDAAKYLPSGRSDVITVTAINKFNEKAQFSNHIQNTNFGIAAPGTSILSTYKKGYGTFDGTSMAAPHVAGLVAVLKAYRPRMTTSEAYNIINKTGLASSDNAATGKVINPPAAIKYILE